MVKLCEIYLILKRVKIIFKINLKKLFLFFKIPLK